MEEIIENIKAVISTLDGGIVGMPTTYDNMSKLVGCMQVLTDIVDKLEKAGKEHDA